MLSAARKFLDEAAVDFEALIEVGLNENHSMFTFGSPGSKAMQTFRCLEDRRLQDRRLQGSRYKAFLLGAGEDFEEFIEHLGLIEEMVEEGTWSDFATNQARLSQFKLDDYLARALELHVPSTVDARLAVPQAHSEEKYWHGIPAYVYFGLVQDLEDFQLPLLIPFGSSFASPAPEVHAAFLERWQKYGARLLSVSLGAIDLFVAKPPVTSEDCLQVAREHFGYCPSVLEQEALSLEAYGESLRGNTIWSFCFDLQ